MRPWILTLLLAGACSPDENATDDGGGQTTPDEGVSVLIVAADGGTVTVDDATLDIPPGALAVDTTITGDTVDASGLPDSATIVGDGYDFGPDGLQFLIPATLTIDEGSAPATGKTYVVSWLDSTGAWIDLATTITGTAASAPVEHFTALALRSVDLPPDVDVCEFTACQGDVVGSWHLLGICIPDFQNPFEQICPTSTYEATFDQDGTYDILAGGTYAYDTTTTISYTATFPAACNTEFSTCDFWATVTMGKCTGDPTVECDCSGTYPSEPSQGSGTWDYDGDQVWFDDGGGRDYSDYCRDGSLLKGKSVDDGIITTLSL